MRGGRVYGFSHATLSRWRPYISAVVQTAWLRYKGEGGEGLGLQPCYFITLATPHLGCDADGLAQVKGEGGEGLWLQPCHFITLATLHLGCGADGLAQVQG